MVTTPTSLHPPSREAIMGSIWEMWVTLGLAMIALDLLCLIISKVVRERERQRDRETDRDREGRERETKRGIERQRERGRE